MAVSVVLVLVDPLLIVFPLMAVPSFFAAVRSEGIRQHAWRAMSEPNRQVRHLFDLGTSAVSAKEIRIQRLGADIREHHRAARADANRIMRRADWQAALLSLAAWLLYGLAYGVGTLLVVRQAIDGRISVSDIVLVVLVTGQLNRQIIEGLMMFAWLGTTLKIAERFVWLRDYARRDDPQPLAQFRPGSNMALTYNTSASATPLMPRCCTTSRSTYLPARW